MNKLIYNDVFWQKVFKRKFRTGIAYHACIMDYLSSKQRVFFTIQRLMEIPISQARIVIQYWEKTKVATDLLDKYGLNSYQVKREYKKGHVKPGYINIDVSSQTLNEAFLYELLKRHYDKDFSRPNALDLVPYFIIDTGNSEIIAIKCYDDRGFYQYFIRKDDKRIKKLEQTKSITGTMLSEDHGDM